MNNFFQEQEYFIENIRFDYNDCRYSGNGVMNWNSTTGFHIVAHVKRSKPLPPRTDIKLISLERKALIRMKLSDGVLAIVPRVSVDDLAIIGGYLSLNVKYLIFIQHIKRGQKPSSSWFGSALYETRTNLILPDLVSQETRIGNLEPLPSHSLSGFHYEDNFGQKVVGQLNDKKFLDINWSLPNSNWTKLNNWHFAKGLQDAISMISGEVIQLRSHQSYRCGRIYEEMRVGEQPFKLDILFRPFDYQKLNKNMVIQLANFLTCDSKESDICRRIFYQMADASQQRTSRASELLLSTILEAALRTLYNDPFVPDENKRTDSFSLEGVLQKFRKQYFADNVQVGREWKKIISRVVQIQRRLRDHNAHPDWLSIRNNYNLDRFQIQFTGDKNYKTLR